MSGPSQIVADTLEQLASSGYFQPRHEERLQKLRDANPDWYKKSLHEEGIKQAESQLAEWANSRHLHRFAAAVGQTALGVIALAQVDRKGEDTQLLKDSSRLPYASQVSNAVNPKVILATIPRHRCCSCQDPLHAEVWAGYGYLPLKAVTLAYDMDDRDKGAVLGLYFAPKKSELEKRQEAFRFVAITTIGEVAAESHQLELQPYHYMAYTWGVVPKTAAISVSTHYAAVESILGFPGADEYLAEHISTLGDYLTTLATKLQPHQH